MAEDEYDILFEDLDEEEDDEEEDDGGESSGDDGGDFSGGDDGGDSGGSDDGWASQQDYEENGRTIRKYTDHDGTDYFEDVGPYDSGRSESSFSNQRRDAFPDQWGSSRSSDDSDSTFDDDDPYRSPNRPRAQPPEDQAPRDYSPQALARGRETPQQPTVTQLPQMGPTAEQAQAQARPVATPGAPPQAQPASSQAQPQNLISAAFDAATKQMMQDQLGREIELGKKPGTTAVDLPLLSQIAQDWQRESGRRAPNRADQRDMDNFWKYSQDWVGVASDHDVKTLRGNQLAAHDKSFGEAAAQRVTKEREAATQAAQRTQPRDPTQPVTQPTLSRPSAQRPSEQWHPDPDVANAVNAPRATEIPQTPRQQAVTQEDADYGNVRRPVSESEDDYQLSGATEPTPAPAAPAPAAPAPRQGAAEQADMRPYSFPDSPDELHYRDTQDLGDGRIGHTVVDKATGQTWIQADSAQRPAQAAAPAPQPQAQPSPVANSGYAPSTMVAGATSNGEASYGPFESELINQAQPVRQHGPFQEELIQGPRVSELTQGPLPSELIQGPRQGELIQGPNQSELVQGPVALPLTAQVADVAQERPLDAAAMVLLGMQQGKVTTEEPGGDQQAATHLAAAFSAIIRNPNAPDSSWAKPALEAIARMAHAHETGQSGAPVPPEYIKSWIGAWRKGEGPPLSDQLDRQMREAGAWTPSSPLPVNWRAKWGDDITSDVAQARLMRDPSFRAVVDSSLTQAEANSICGPIAARAFVRANGRDITLRESIELARSVGFNPSQGMAGIQSQQKLLTKMGVDSEITPIDAFRWAQEVDQDKPVIINSGAHYWVATKHDKANGKFYVGSTGLALGGSEWMSIGDMSAASNRLGKGPVTGGLVMKSPVATSPGKMQPQDTPAAAPGDTGSDDLGDIPAPNLRGLVLESAAANGVSAALLAGQIEQESGWKQGATSRAGARGYLQLMPDTARSLGVTDITDPRQNIMAGGKYLRQMTDQFGSDELGLAAYNAGPGRVSSAIRQAGGRRDWASVSRFLPQETAHYVPVVLKNRDRFRRR
jgi:hypothetical protein